MSIIKLRSLHVCASKVTAMCTFKDKLYIGLIVLYIL